jgi:hypothetical protein
MDCARCGSEASTGDEFCRKCGARLGEEQAAPSSLMPPPIYPPPSTSRGGRSSGLAIASLVLGIFSFMCLPIIGAVLAVVFGLLARGDIKRSQGRLRGRGMSLAGIILGTANLAILIILAAIFIPLAVINAGKTETIHRSVQAQGAKTLVAALEMRNGRLRVSGGAGDIFEGSFTSNVTRWEPDIDYGLNGSEGDLQVIQGESGFPRFWDTRNEWELRFNDSIPLDLTTSLSSASASFHMNTLPVISLQVDSSSGDVDADLSGTKTALDRLKLTASSGDINVNLRGIYEMCVQLDMQDSSGRMSLDLRGQWQNGLSGRLTSSSGDVSLQLPGDVGVRVRVNTDSGAVNNQGMKLESQNPSSSVYVNDAYGNSPVTLEVGVQTSSGDVNLALGG